MVSVNSQTERDCNHWRALYSAIYGLVPFYRETDKVEGYPLDPSSITPDGIKIIISNI